MKPTKPPLSSAVYYSKAADTVYESLDDDNKVQWLPSHHCEPLEYSYPEHTLPVELQNRSSSNNTAPLVEEPEPLYHDVGPDASSQSANARLYTPGHDQNSCRNISEEDTVKSKAKVCIVVTLLIIDDIILSDRRLKNLRQGLKMLESMSCQRYTFSWHTCY